MNKSLLTYFVFITLIGMLIMGFMLGKIYKLKRNAKIIRSARNDYSTLKKFREDTLKEHIAKTEMLLKQKVGTPEQIFNLILYFELMISKYKKEYVSHKKEYSSKEVKKIKSFSKVSGEQVKSGTN